MKHIHSKMAVYNALRLLRMEGVHDPSRIEIEDITGLSKPAVQMAVRTLENIGAIRRQFYYMAGDRPDKTRYILRNDAPSLTAIKDLLREEKG